MKICENQRCKKDHDGSYGSGRFCSNSCAHSRIYTDDYKQNLLIARKNSLAVKKSYDIRRIKNENEKIKSKLRDESLIYNCERCGKEKIGKYGSGRFCSVECANTRTVVKGTKKYMKCFECDTICYVGVHTAPRCCICDVCKGVKHRSCPTCGKEMYSKSKFCSKLCARRNSISIAIESNKHNPEMYKKMSSTRKKMFANGSLKVTGGTTKWYDYNDIRVQGTYELRTCKILDIWKSTGKIKNWEYTNDRIQYIGHDDKCHSYLIDFKVFVDDTSWYYLEVKGKMGKQDKYKWRYTRKLGHKLVVWRIRDIEKFEMEINN